MDKTKFKNLFAAASKLVKFGVEKQADDTPEKFEAVKIKDGDTMVEFNPSLEVGTPVMVAGGDGSSPAPDGVYEFDSGIKFTVKEGKIESVEEDGKTDDPPADPPKNEFEGEVVTMEMYNALLARVEALENKAPQDFSHLPTVEVINAFKVDMMTFGETFNEAITELGKIPMHTPEDIDEDAEENRAINFEAVATAFTKAE